MTSFDYHYGHLRVASWSDDLEQFCFSHMALFREQYLWSSTPSENLVASGQFIFVYGNPHMAKSPLANNKLKKERKRNDFFLSCLVNSCAWPSM